MQINTYKINYLRNCYLNSFKVYVMRHAKTRRFSLDFVQCSCLKRMVHVRIVENGLTTESNSEIIQLSINPFI